MPRTLVQIFGPPTFKRRIVMRGRWRAVSLALTILMWGVLVLAAAVHR